MLNVLNSGCVGYGKALCSYAGPTFRLCIHPHSGRLERGCVEAFTRLQAAAPTAAVSVPGARLGELTGEHPRHRLRGPGSQVGRESTQCRRLSSVWKLSWRRLSTP